MKKLLTMFAIVCAFLASCDSEGGDLNRTPLLKVVGPDGSDPSQPISIDGKSQEVAFTVLATADWTADIAGDEGFALSDRSGATGNTKVTVVAARNLSGATRSATVSFRLGGEERYAYTISQTEEQPYLDVDPATISIVGDRTEFTVAVSTNQSPWKVEIDSPDGDGWLTQQSKESASITFLAEENTTGRNRTATLKFVSELHPEVFNYVTVTQGYVVPAPTADLLDVVFPTRPCRPSSSKNTTGTPHASRANRAVLRPYWKADSTRWSTTTTPPSRANSKTATQWRCSCAVTTIPKNCRSNLSLRAKAAASASVSGPTTRTRSSWRRARRMPRAATCGKPPSSESAPTPIPTTRGRYHSTERWSSHASTTIRSTPIRFTPSGNS